MDKGEHETENQRSTVSCRTSFTNPGPPIFVFAVKWFIILCMNLEDLKRFENFNVWDIEYGPLCLVADDRETCRPVRLSLNMDSRELIVSSVPLAETPESSFFLSEEKAFAMLLNGDFPADI